VESASALASDVVAVADHPESARSDRFETDEWFVALVSVFETAERE